jgi:hypothetical protein
METKSRRSLAYKRETYRLWFEYLRLARMSTTKEVKAALKGTGAFYAPWGDVAGIKFDEWWKTHAHLFEEKFVVRALEQGAAAPAPQSLVVEIPLTQSFSEIMKAVRHVVRDAFKLRRPAHRKDTRLPSAVYHPTIGAEPKLGAVREMLTVYRDVYLANPKLRGEKLLDAAHRFYVGRKNKRWAKVPMALHLDTDGGKIRPMRNLRRYIQKAERVMLNVARGEFPGKY